MKKDVFKDFLISDKLKFDTLWNLLSYIIIGLSGISLPILTAKYYTPTTLGILNISLIILTISSQISGFGIHFSVLKYVSEFSKNKLTVNAIMAGSLILVTITAISYCLLFYVMINPIILLFPGMNLKDALILIIPAIYLLSVNKIILSYYNALRIMKYYAFLNTIRYINWIIFLIIFINFEINSLYLPSIFVLSEIVIFVINIPAILMFKSKINIANINGWIKEHFNFGFKSMIGAIFVDFNSRIDVLFLGLFTNPHMTGLYTIASMVLDGFMQLIIVFRIIINPLITRSFSEYSEQEFIARLKRGKLIFYIISFPLLICTILIFPLAISFLKLDIDYNKTYIPFIISTAGLIISFGYQPFQMIFIQTGFPLVQTIFWGFLLAVNLLLSSLLISAYGLIGAGIASAAVFLITPIIMNLLTKKYLNISF